MDRCREHINSHTPFDPLHAIADLVLDFVADLSARRPCVGLGNYTENEGAEGVRFESDLATFGLVR